MNPQISISDSSDEPAVGLSDEEEIRRAMLAAQGGTGEIPEDYQDRDLLSFALGADEYH